jgi:branched-chain amino acid transport system ATP-binding protein
LTEGSAPLLRIEGLTVSYGQVVALRDVGLSVGQGEAVALVGANGAGKSTLLKSIIGLLYPRSGTITFDGRPIHRLPSYRRSRLHLGYCPEGREIFPNMTVRENLEVACWSLGAERKRKLESTYAIFPQLVEKDSIAGWQLSGGQQQMLAIGRALMGDPELLLLDEPSLGLSPLLVSEMFKTIARIVQQGTAVLLAEQNASKALQICHRAYVLNLGAVVLSGSAAELRESEDVKRAYLGG